MRITTLTFLFVLAISCRKKEDPVPPPGTGSISIDISHKAGDDQLEIGEWYKNENGDSISISTFKYFISNIRLASATGNYSEAESYYLIDEENSSSKTITIDDVPQGDYTQISFLIGIDSAHNEMGALPDVMDAVANEMFWDWNTGYIMAKLEGNSPQSDLTDGFFAYHIGGYKGPYQSLQTVTINFAQPLHIAGKNFHKTIEMTGDVLEWFKSPNTIKIKELPVFMNPGADAKKIADNYADMFTIDLIK